jgi:O-succinylbenzoate synthase
VRAAEVAVDAGASLVVLKVRPGWSIAPVAAVRAALGEAVEVAVDANGSFGVADLDELRALDAEGPAFVEQPAPAGDLEASARIAAALAAPVALDESVVTARDLAAAISVEAGAMLTVKPARLAGVASATIAADRARQAGWRLHVGGMLESGLGRAAARLLAARPDVDGASLVGPTTLLFDDDVVDPVLAHDGVVAVHAGPGLAPPPDPARLARLTVAAWTGRAAT